MVTTFKTLAVTVSILAASAANAADMNNNTDYETNRGSVGKAAISANVTVRQVDPVNPSHNVTARSQNNLEDLSDKTPAEYRMDVDVEAGATGAPENKAAIAAEINTLKSKDGELVKISGTVMEIKEEEFTLADATGTVTINNPNSMDVLTGQEVAVIGDVDSGLFGTEVDAIQIVRLK